MSTLAIRRKRTRTKLKQVTSRPRLTVFKSNQHIYCQVIDDINGQTLVAANTLQEQFKSLEKKSNIAAAIAVGKRVGSLALEKGVSKVVFDKGGYAYHGKVKAIADAVREVGVQV
jgi:large subunit ribosomal protein L18